MARSLQHRDDAPVVRLGQGEYMRELNASDLIPGAGPQAAPLDLKFLVREPAGVYHAKAKDNLSSHALADFRRCPALYRKKRLGLVPERDSAALLIGRAAHTLILEGRERFEAEYAVGGPVNPRTGKPFGSNTKAFAEWAERVGTPVLDDWQAARIEQMAASVRGHLFARELLREGVAERVVRCEFGGHRCQARIDWINPTPGRGIVDLKTCECLDGFESDFRAFGYAHQLAFYRVLVHHAAGVALPVYVIAVEKREPYRCGVWQVARHVLDAAQRENHEAMRELTRCRSVGVWPTRFESLRLIDTESAGDSRMEAVVLVPGTQGTAERRSKPKGWAICCEHTGYWYNGEALTERCWSKDRCFAKRYPSRRGALSALAELNHTRIELDDLAAAGRRPSPGRTPRRRTIR